jgi:hypothetical protein
MQPGRFIPTLRSLQQLNCAKAIIRNFAGEAFFISRYALSVPRSDLAITALWHEAFAHSDNVT